VFLLVIQIVPKVILFLFQVKSALAHSNKTAFTYKTALDYMVTIYFMLFIVVGI